MKSFKEQADELIESYSRTKRNHPETMMDCYEKGMLETLIQAGEYFCRWLDSLEGNGLYELGAIWLIGTEVKEIRESIIKLKKVIK